MAPKPQFKVSIPLHNADNFCSTHLISTTGRDDIHLDGMSELQLRLKATVERVTFDPATFRNKAPREVEEGHTDLDSNDTASNYGDSKVSEVQSFEVKAQSATTLESTESHCSYEICSPESYAEFTTNPYSSCVDSTGASSQKKEADHPENIDETLARLSNNLNCAYDAIKSEESATLKLLQELCA
ncbi:hypothetical protein F4781DRAFT_414877 [Annulohypoxylon bovei var. microspora]|nr:hypothetical protein F4781DRAFT_414877 [Annulohypoxylon bovei var. microspora]